MLIDTLHIIQDDDTVDQHKQFHYRTKPYMVLNTKEYGPIMYCHTSDKGEFCLSIEDIKEIFKRYDCSALVTCFPKQHVVKHADLVKLFNILYLEYDVTLWHTMRWDDSILVTTDNLPEAIEHIQELY